MGKDSAVSDPLEYGDRAYRAVMLIAIVAIIVCFFTFGLSWAAVFWAIGIGVAGIAFGAVAAFLAIFFGSGRKDPSDKKIRR
jgi:hypothetical protein